MYRKKSDGFMYIVASFMVTFVLVFMAGTTYCRVQEDKPVEEPKKEVKMVARIEGWNKNNKDFSVDDKKVEIDIDATGSTTDVKYFVKVSNIPEGIKLYKDENYFYELGNEFDGVIDYKETMKEKIVFYIENNIENAPEINGENESGVVNEVVPQMINVKLEFEKR